MGIEKTTAKVLKNGAIPVGRAKSGRLWKAPQTERSSALKKKGVLSHMAKTFEEKQRMREEKKAVQELENEMKEVKRQTKIAEREAREDKEKRKIANELKSSSFQNVRLLSKMFLLLIKSMFCDTTDSLVLLYFSDQPCQDEGNEQKATQKHQEDFCE